jgi:hypothetical protein
LYLCAGHLLHRAVSRAVLLKADRDIQGKLGPEVLERCYRLLVVQAVPEEVGPRATLLPGPVRAGGADPLTGSSSAK